MKEKLTA